jgi:hypothetical protein
MLAVPPAAAVAVPADFVPAPPPVQVILQLDKDGTTVVEPPAEPLALEPAAPPAPIVNVIVSPALTAKKPSA